MIGLGTIINTAAILAGGILGAVFGKFLSESARNTLTKVCGVSTLFIALHGALGKMTELGGSFERLGEYLKVKSGNARDRGFVNAIVTASLTVYIGAMAVVGSIQDGLLGDYSILATKAVPDLIIIMVMSSSLGKGTVFSAVHVRAVLQGSITALAGLLRPVMTDLALSNLSQGAMC